MKPIIILQHVDNDGPCYFTEFLAGQGLTWQIVRADLGEPLPADINLFSGYAILGGPMSANDPLPHLGRAIELIGEAMDANVPVIGHCLGGQLMARALGAAVTASPSAEIGWHMVESCSNAAAQRWFAGAQRFPQFQWHHEAFGLPTGAERLATSAHCAHQAFSVNNKHLAMQFHTEVDIVKIDDWLGPAGAADIASVVDAPGVQSIESIATRTADVLADSQRIAGAIYAAWCAGLKG
jgi:GMP synthase-like glutamine amidotransferase